LLKIMPDILEMIKNSGKCLFVGLAGPGTGKTHAFKVIIKSDEFKDKKILILSFINKLIDDLTEDFKDFNNVEVKTLHKFARQKFIEQFKRNVDLDKGLDDYISEDFVFINGSDIKYDKKFYENKLTEDELKFYENRKNFYRRKDDLHSFNSIIHTINSAFEKDELAIPEYDLVLIDEFQDFNRLEWRLIELLNKKTKVILVGDDDQSLYYDFRSAKPKLIRDLFDRDDTCEFTLDDCYRCTNVIVDTVNSFIANVKKNGYLKSNKIKKFNYPTQRTDDKNEVSKKYNQIDFLPSVPGDRLIYQLKQRIMSDISDIEEEKEKRILVIVPSYLKQKIYDGLIKEEFNIVEYELFSDQKRGKVKHSDIIDVFNVLIKRKTDNLALRKILFLYLTGDETKDLIIQSNKEEKKLWNCLDEDIKKEIGDDIDIFKKVKRGQDELSTEDLSRLNIIFNLKKILSKTIKGFGLIKRGAIEIEVVTVMGSKGLAADFVYYVGIDNRSMLDQKVNKITDQKICEFLVGITRAKKKLTLFSLEDKSPKILDFIDKKYINRITL